MNPVVFIIGQKEIIPQYVQIIPHTMYGTAGMQLNEIYTLQISMGV
tara:strand:- start:26 stop:163 length:138 start_codon:yes stop_codon:yes gene_type:complete